jgi:LmbE family N-acetylglucosaminyl deacetylase
LSDNQKNPALSSLVEEHYNSLSTLGISRESVLLEKFETRKFQDQRQEILEYLIKLNQSFHPDIVFTHTKADLHQDHKTVTEECLRAFRGTSVLGYDVIRSSYGFFPNFLVEVDEGDVQKKVNALAAYSTYRTKYYFDEEITRATLIRNGALVERRYAEGFDTLRIIGSFEGSL